MCEIHINIWAMKRVSGHWSKTPKKKTKRKRKRKRFTHNSFHLSQYHNQKLLTLFKVSRVWCKSIRYHDMNIDVRKRRCDAIAMVLMLRTFLVWIKDTKTTTEGSLLIDNKTQFYHWTYTTHIEYSQLILCSFSS